jgi:hypothetical protein
MTHTAEAAAPGFTGQRQALSFQPMVRWRQNPNRHWETNPFSGTTLPPRTCTAKQTHFRAWLPADGTAEPKDEMHPRARLWGGWE